jgi:peptidoglycan/LPS O-acetylase OafA/YrhL
VRFVCAVAVLVWHYQHFFFVGGAQVGFSRERQPFYPALSFFYERGFYGVEVFWCISGFIFFWKYRDAVACRAVSAWRFTVLRVSRLYPLHLVTLLLVLGLQQVYRNAHGSYLVYEFNDLRHFMLQLFMASNWGFERGDSFNGPIWSISVEVLVYFCFFVLLRYLGRSLLVNAAMLVLSMLARWYGITNPIVECLMFFYLGGIAAAAFRYADRSDWQRPASFAALAVVLAAPPLVIATGLYHFRQFPVLFLLAYVPVLLFWSARHFACSCRTQKVIEAFGNMTYSSYLLHFPLQLGLVLGFTALGMDIPAYSGLFFLAYVAATLFLSLAAYQWLEMPAQNAIRKWAS